VARSCIRWDEMFLREARDAEGTAFLPLEPSWTIRRRPTPSEATDRSAGKVVYMSAFSPKTVERELSRTSFPGWSRPSSSRPAGIAADRRRRPPRNRSAHRDRPRSVSGTTTSRRCCPRIYDKRDEGHRQPAAPRQAARSIAILSTSKVWMSEPGLQELGSTREQISSLEAIHEDLYFVTLDFFERAWPHDDRKRRLGRTRKRSTRSSHPDRPRTGGPGSTVHYARQHGRPDRNSRFAYQGKRNSERPTRVHPGVVAHRRDPGRP